MLLQDFSLSTVYTHYYPLVIAHVAFRSQNYTYTLKYQLQLYYWSVLKLSYNCLVILLLSTGLVVHILSGWAHSFLYLLHMFLSWKAVRFWHILFVFIEIIILFSFYIFHVYNLLLFTVYTYVCGCTSICVCACMCAYMCVCAVACLCVWRPELNLVYCFSIYLLFLLFFWAMFSHWAETLHIA